MQITDAPETHWQMGKVDRKIGFLTEMSISSFSQFELEGPTAVKPTASEMAQVCNQLVANAGSSPNQWVLGSAIHLPASLGNVDNNLAVTTWVVEGSSFWHRLQVEQVCVPRHCSTPRTPAPFDAVSSLVYGVYWVRLAWENFVRSGAPPGTSSTFTADGTGTTVALVATPVGTGECTTAYPLLWLRDCFATRRSRRSSTCT